MQNVNNIFKIRYVDKPKCTIGIPNPYFPNAASNTGHRLPVVRFEAKLHLIQLMTGLSTRVVRKSPQIIQSVAPELSQLHPTLHSANHI
jgi:hypothetical protein